MKQAPITTAGTGSGTLIVNPANRSVSGKLSLQDFTATMAHVHQAVSGFNGGVALDPNASGSDWNVASGAKLNQVLASVK